ncbi:MAG TPA: FtsX-like permease family protein [Devosia sp.]|nr:FtsX-like permease family protein [Devosia sp.]
MKSLLGWLRVALIDLKFDLRQFAVLIACVTLGVATIAAVGSVGAALDGAIGRNARGFLGGDLEASIGYRPATDAERALFDSLGRTAAIAEITSRASLGTASTLIGLRAVEDSYPLAGTLSTTPAKPLPDLLRRQDGLYGAVADPLLFDRLGAKTGDTIRIGNESFRLAGTIDELPDGATRGFSIGATVLIPMAGLPQTGLIAPGVLARFRYKIDLAGKDYDAAAQKIKSAFPDAGWQVRSPREAAASLTRYLDIFDRFLILVGLASLLVGGIGVSNAASAYIAARERSIATMRSLGATAGRIMVHFLAQIMLLGLVGTALGVLLGTVSTLLLLPILAAYFGIGLPAALYPGPLATGAAFGLVTACVFAYLPLLRATRLRPASLFRAAGAPAPLPRRELLRPATGAPLAIGILLLAGLALLVTRAPTLVLWYALGAVAAFLALQGVALLLQRLLRLLPPARGLIPRLALRNIHRPGAPTGTVMLSLGLGLTLMLAIALIESNVRGRLAGEISQSAPSFVLMNMDKPTSAAVSAFAKADKDVSSLELAPFLRGIISKVNGTPVSSLKTLDAEGQRLIGGDHSISWRPDLPPGDRLLQGKWWDANYAGPPLLSVDEDFATPLHLKVGDSLEIAISGRPVTATIANIRYVDWQNASISFAILFSPGLIEGAPATYIGALKTPPAEAREVERQLVAQFPTLGFIPVSEALAQLSAMIGALANAVAMVGGVAVLSGIFVLAGALAAGRKEREADAIVTKVLGATRGQIAAAFALEYGLLGLLAMLVSAVLAAVAAWAVSTHVLMLDFALDPVLTLLVALATVAVTMAVGLAITWSALAARPAAFLRAEE